MSRLSLLVILAAALLLSFAGGLNQRHATAWKELYHRFATGGETADTVHHFKTGLLDAANYPRIAAQNQLLAEDLELERWLQKEFAGGLPLDDPDFIAGHIESNWPRYMKIGIHLASGPSLRAIRHHLQTDLSRTDAEATHLTTVLRPAGAGIATQALVVTGQRLQDFSPEILHQCQDTVFLNRCPHCHTTHTIRIQREQPFIRLDCPACRRIGTLAAPDSEGRYRHAPRFLAGYQPPAVYPKNQSRWSELFTIWSTVHGMCAQTPGRTAVAAEPACWQTAAETQNLGWGGSEAAAILLADWLIARGFEARVALGSCGDIRRHTWCVVRFGSGEYLLDATVERSHQQGSPQLVSRVGNRYTPEVLFDRLNLYVPKTPGQRWNGSYWSASHWVPVNTLKERSKSMASLQIHRILPQGPLQRPSQFHFTKPAPALFSVIPITTHRPLPTCNERVFKI